MTEATRQEELGVEAVHGLHLEQDNALDDCDEFTDAVALGFQLSATAILRAGRFRSASMGPMDRGWTAGSTSRSTGGFVTRLVTRGPLSTSQPSKLPWDDPGFSERMLREHLDQSHDRASRRFATIDAHVAWIFDELLGRRPGSVLDLGCGPGLYTERLAERGCVCLGIDVSPASVAHARGAAADRASSCTYVLGDVRSVDLGSGHALAMCLFGEFNTFSRTDARALLARVGESLAPGGLLLLEAHTYDSVVAEGAEPRGWYTSSGGLFSDRPHVVLHEHGWNATAATAQARYFIVDDTDTIGEYAEALTAYTDDDYRRLLLEAGFTDIEMMPGMGASRHRDMVVITATRTSSWTTGGSG